MAEDRSEREEEPTLEGGLAPYSLPLSQEGIHILCGVMFGLDIMTSVLNSDTT